MQGPPGSGKTKMIVDKASINDVILTMTRPACENIKQRLKIAGKLPIKKNCMTIE